jgi:hypothetical protein
VWLIVAGKVVVFAFWTAACRFLAKSILGFPRIGGRDSIAFDDVARAAHDRIVSARSWRARITYRIFRTFGIDGFF